MVNKCNKHKQSDAIALRCCCGCWAAHDMKPIIAVLILLLPMNALASWRQFARVTPATQLDYELLVEVRPLPEKTGIYGIRLPAKSKNHYLKSAWLIVTELPLSEASQNFSRMEGSRKIVVKSKLQVQPVAARRQSEVRKNSII